MFKKILIANRGEIACRIIQTAHQLGIECVAVYSDADADALHTKLADSAFHIGPSPVGESYLCADKIITLAKQENCEAIHPGYGFLAENADFANACEQEGICFIGPSSKAIAAMGVKSHAKKIMVEANIPVLPGYHEEAQDPKTLLTAAKQIQFPVLLKAASGGGGKGMRIVWKESEFLSSLEAVKREAQKSFGDDRMIIEKYLTNTRHIEVQVFADKYNNVVHCFDRDCSIQRRHQKIIEEAPAPHISNEVRTKMASTAIDAAKAINYVNAGTIEFLLDQDQSFYFMEMNTRLQVEHPVTEMITGIDLVEWQLKVAAGEPLPLTQQQIVQQGHAVEARIYAEDPSNQFLPSTGKLQALKMPDNVRIDSGIALNDSVSPYYDPMVAKFISWDQGPKKCDSKIKNSTTRKHHDRV